MSDKKKRSTACTDIACGWPMCPDGAIPETKPGDCCPSCPGKLLSVSFFYSLSPENYCKILILTPYYINREIEKLFLFADAA